MRDFGRFSPDLKPVVASVFMSKRIELLENDEEYAEWDENITMFTGING